MGNHGTCCRSEKGEQSRDSVESPSPVASHKHASAFSRLLLSSRCPSGAKDDDDFARLLESFEQMSTQVARHYRQASEGPSPDQKLLAKADDVLRRVSLHLRRLQQFRGRVNTWQGEEADRWLDMWTGRKRRFRSLTEIVRKVQVENRIVRHWRHHAVLSRLRNQAGCSLALLRRPSDCSKAASPFELDTWDSVNMFEIERKCEQPLKHTFMSIWHHRWLGRLSKAPDSKVVDYIVEVERSYRDNPYHNRIHAAEVTASAYYFWSAASRQPELDGYFTQVDLFVLLFAAAIHDMEHPGVSNDFLVKTGSTLAVRYHDRAVLENFHLASAFGLLQAMDLPLLELMLPSAPAAALRSRVVDMVLGTDMAVHKPMLEELDAELMDNASKHDIDKRFLERSLLHMADLGHALRPAAQHQEWARRVTQEFFMQGDREKDLGLVPITLNDRLRAPSLPQSQIGFLNFVVVPTWKPLMSFLGSSAEKPEECLRSNLEAWQTMARQDEAALGGC